MNTQTSNKADCSLVSLYMFFVHAKVYSDFNQTDHNQQGQNIADLDGEVKMSKKRKRGKMFLSLRNFRTKVVVAHPVKMFEISDLLGLVLISTKNHLFPPLIIRIIWSPWKTWEPPRSHEEDSNFLQPGSIGHFVLEIQSLKSRSNYQRLSKEAKKFSYQKCEHWKRPHQEGGEVEELVLDHIEEFWLVNQAVPGSRKNQVYIIKTYISTFVHIRKPYTVCSSGLRSWKVPNILSQIWETWFIHSRKTQNMHKYHRKESTIVLVQTISVWPMVHLRFRKCKQQKCLWHQGLKTSFNSQGDKFLNRKRVTWWYVDVLKISPRGPMSPISSEWIQNWGICW